MRCSQDTATCTSACTARTNIYGAGTLTCVPSCTGTVATALILIIVLRLIIIMVIPFECA